MKRTITEKMKNCYFMVKHPFSSFGVGNSSRTETEKERRKEASVQAWVKWVLQTSSCRKYVQEFIVHKLLSTAKLHQLP